MCIANSACVDRAGKDRAWTGCECRYGLVLVVLLLKWCPCTSLQVSGTRYVSTLPLLQAMLPSSPLFGNERGKNLLDGGAPFYDV